MKNRILSFYDWFLIAGVLASNFTYAGLSGQYDLPGMIAAITGVLCVVLVAKGSIWNYAFGLVNVSLYAYISFKASLYGDAALNAFYYVPMQFIGWWLWRKRGAAVSDSEAGNGTGQVKARRFTWTQRALLAVGCIVAVVLVGIKLDDFGDPQPFKDSLTTVLSIIAQILMACAFMEQWALWIITNIVSVVMWSIFVARGVEHAVPMLLMWIFYLLNSINGFRQWLKLSE